ncbi:unnamed protein product [Chrysoparadoxa australica]
MIYNMYIFNRQGACLYYQEWNRTQNVLQHDVEEEKRLMFGMLHSLCWLVGKMDCNGDEAGGLQTLKTSAYTLHHLDTPSGLRFVLLTDNYSPDCQGVLKELYSEVWCDYVSKHPSYEPKSGSPVTSPSFQQQLEAFLRAQSCFGPSEAG